MHGIILGGLEAFVRDVAGPETWEGVVREAEPSRGSYDPDDVYPDEEFRALLEAATGQLDEDPLDLQRAFGRAIVPDLLDRYGDWVDEEWSALELLERTEAAMHHAVRQETRLATPPPLACKRTGEDEIRIEYRSPRELCGFAMGIVDGIGDHFEEDLELDEPRCMHRGDGLCELYVRAQA